MQTVNLHHVALAERDDEFRAALLNASHVTADGWPLVALLQSADVDVERVTGSDWLHRTSGNGTLARHRVALFGASPQAGARFAELINPGLRFAEHGRKEDWDAESAVKTLNERQIDLVIVAVTPPFGDVFGAALHAAGYRGSVISVGGSVDMLVGLQQRAPRLAQVTGTEWLWRLANSPRRLAHRYLVLCIPTLIATIAPEILANRRSMKATRT
ncbi:N-acetylglucosaminyldiphosphoundecaprenol N-acetyl-beta-D-mannosaminyltransferase [Microbacterium trichothecenolyticum]|uniref:WecB/TagA/CpsF family glycosyltransferase n=1 Tax=Microbacterium trichothecenolyticum TaxID=69370 RepID=UPI002855CA29|nr:WecB/TagA/CpsF family glycosyltransferase [Microbacterium trichothecenolyticum]MDR7184915.1 N-acetylglucosaminyldiphosphoundecaprenol N-acetyl-beta-D-mannosaminyltransferase [Microbacterium trichothecenolyticum]